MQITFSLKLHGTGASNLRSNLKVVKISILEFEGPNVHQKTFVHVGLNVIKSNEPDRLQSSSNIGKPIYSCYNETFCDKKL